MFNRICIIFNSVLCSLFVLLALYALIVEQDFSSLSLSIVSIIFLFSGVFIWFNFICGRVNRMNKERIVISKRLKITGKVVFTLSILSQLVIFFIITEGAIDFYTTSTAHQKSRNISFLFVLLIFFLVCFSAIVNLIFFIRALRKNKAMINELINEIGII